MKLIWLLLLCATLPFSNTSAQHNLGDSLGVYRVNPWVSGGVALAGTYTNIVGLPKVKDKDRVTEL